jgi:ATP-dependent Clp protease ATP-binding subunit ClpB
MTSNIGSDLVRPGMSGAEIEKLRDQALRGHFRPEFLNRLDGILPFLPLGPEQMAGILDIQLARLAPRLAARELELRVTPAARDRLARRGYDPDFGARPLKRLIQQTILDPLAQGILEGRMPPGTVVVVDAVGPERDPERADDPGITVRIGPASAAA